jgi:hypothetical protein
MKGLIGIIRADPNTQKLKDHGNWFSEMSIPIDPLPLKENPRLKEKKVVSLSNPWLVRPAWPCGKVASSSLVVPATKLKARQIDGLFLYHALLRIYFRKPQRS